MPQYRCQFGRSPPNKVKIVPESMYIMSVAQLVFIMFIIAGSNTVKPLDISGRQEITDHLDVVGADVVAPTSSSFSI